MISNKRRAIAALVITPALLLAACGTSDGAGSGGQTDAQADTDVSGKIVISGSSTVEPITALVREEFIAQNDKVDISVDGPGTGDGFELFCKGETDISNASRPIKAEEADACKAQGIEFVELKVGIDGLSVIVNPDNALECLSMADLYALVGPESEGFKTWSDAQKLADELGSTTKMPDQSLVVTAPGAESGTYDSFVELVLDKVGETRVESGAITEDTLGSARADYSAQADDNVIIEGAASEPGGLGWVGFAFADQAEGVKLMPVSKELGGDCVEPTSETIQDGSYPISRSLYIYVNKAKAEENKAVASFVDFYLAGLDSFVTEADYIPLADDAETNSTWKNMTVGTTAS